MAKYKNVQVCEIQNVGPGLLVQAGRKKIKKSLIYTFWLFTNLYLFDIMILDKLNETSLNLSKNILRKECYI